MNIATDEILFLFIKGHRRWISSGSIVEQNSVLNILTKKIENFLLYLILLYAFRDVTLVYDDESVNLNRQTFITC